MKLAVYLYDLNTGGAEKIMVGFMNFLSEQEGIDVTLILAQNNGPYISIINHKIKIVILNKKKALASIIPLYKYLKKNQFDCLYTTLINSNLISILVGKLAGTKVVIRIASTISAYKKSKKKNTDEIALFLTKYLYKYSHKCIAISENVKKDLIEFTDYPTDKIKVIYNPINIIDTIEDITLDKEYFHVGIVTRLIELKNIETIIKIIEAFITKNYKITFHFFGDGKQKDLLKDLICKNNNPDIIKIYGFELSYYSYVKNMNLFLHIPLWEGLGNSVLEVYNSGLPMILSNVNSGFSELIKAQYPNVHYFDPTKDTTNIIILIERYINKEIPVIIGREKICFDSDNVYRQYQELAL